MSEGQYFLPKNKQSTEICEALNGSGFRLVPGYHGTQNFCLGVLVGLPTTSFEIGRLLASVNDVEVSYDIHPNGRQLIVFPAAKVRLGLPDEEGAIQF